MKTYRTIESPVGALSLVATEDWLSEVRMSGDGPGPRRPAGSVPEDAAEQLREYFAGERKEFTLPIRPEGTDFQLRVWQVLTAIPYGRTQTYAEVADAVGRPDRIRAVAAMIGRNPLAIVVPCHRVIGSDGSLTGYVGGLVRKRFLLDLESPPRQGRLFDLLDDADLTSQSARAFT